MERLVCHVFAVCFILCICVCRSIYGQNSCWLSYKTIREFVPYCEASSWVHWACLNTCSGFSTQMNNITHVRALCCCSSNCSAECNFPKDYDRDTQYCGNVCPPFFNMSPPSTASTSGSFSTIRIWFNSTPGKRQSLTDI